MTLWDVYRPLSSDDNMSHHIHVLYELLGERSKNESISHKEMPDYSDHEQFVLNKPYKAWYFILDGRSIVGAVYLSKQNEIGVHIFKSYRRAGYAKDAIKQLMDEHEGPFYANVNPNNRKSRELFKKLGGELIQVTYEL